jgi:recombination protein RecR
MNILPKAVSVLIQSFEKLPGIGPKTAQRLVFYLLHVPQKELDEFAERLSGLKSKTVTCSICKNIVESDPCHICSHPGRDKSVICVVANPADVLAIERTGQYQGVYHVLHGLIDPLNNIGPDEIYLADLLRRVSVTPDPVREVILAVSPTMEGEATAMYLSKELSRKSPLKVTRLAHGLPTGSDIEYADEVTLIRALEGRRQY